MIIETPLAVVAGGVFMRENACFAPILLFNAFIFMFYHLPKEDSLFNRVKGFSPAVRGR
jgi:hypothetical protein